MEQALKDFFANDAFMPHGHCFLWLKQILWLHVFSDGLVALAYFSIPLMLLWFIRKRADLPFKGLFVLFSAFILLCGITHLFSIWVLWNPDYGMEGIIKLATGIVSGITALVVWKLLPQALALPSPIQLHKMAEASRINEERLNLALSGASDGLRDWNIITGETYYSPRFREMLGYSEKEFPGHIDSFNNITHPEDRERIAAELKKHFAEHAPYNIEYRLQHKNGHYIWFNSRGQAAFDASGKPVRMTGFITDISQPKAIEQMKSEFISTVSHELRTPLTSIRGALGLITGGAMGNLPEKVTELVGIAYKNSTRLVHIIDDILDIEKIESGRMETHPKTVPLAELLKQSVEANHSYGEKYRVSFMLHDVPQDMKVTVDPDRLMQAMANLLSNAAKFSFEGGTVEINAKRKDGRIHISVRDYGQGIPEAFHSHIFEKFAQADGSTTRRSEGTGLGLSITKKLVEAMGGSIGFETETGKGTTFFFDLAEPPVSIMEPTPQTNPSGHSLRILVCEDDRDIGMLLRTMLEPAGFIVDNAYTLAEARRCLLERSYAAMTLDMALPDGSGADLLKSMHKLTTNPPPVLIVSGSEMAKDIGSQVAGVMVKSHMSETKIVDTILSLIHQAANSKKQEIL